MGRFSGMNESKTFESGSYFDGPGEYVASIKDVLFKDTRKSGPAVIVSFEIVTSNVPDKTPAGCARSYVQPLKNKDVAFPNLLAFLAAGWGLDVTDPADKATIDGPFAKASEQTLEDACEKKTLNGRRVRITADYHITAKKEQITRLRFAPFKG